MPRCLLLALLLTACAAQTMNPEERVTLESALSPEDASTHVYVGDVVTAEPSEFDGDQSAAEVQLRKYAFRRGADLVVIDKTKRYPCELNPELSCVYLRGQAYKRKM